ncbi:MAG: hypothetical protein RJA70_3013 [Pseudomonadota bacterium]|jgi:hypothetical protein
MRHIRLISYLFFGALSVALPSCKEDDKETADDTDEGEVDAGDGENGGSGGKGSGGKGSGGKGSGGKGDTGGMGGSGTMEPDGGTPDGGTAGGGPVEPDPVVCPALNKRKVVKVAAEVTKNATWTCENTYVLETKTFVTGGTVTVEAGTVVQGMPGSALIFTTESRLVTQGTADAPVVFTGALDKGARAGGDWAGLVLLGKAPINVGPIEGLPAGTNKIEGLPTDETRSSYGGTDAKHDCGQLKYTRIEWAGEELSIGKELNVLTMGGCGSDTTLDYVQLHQGLDDGLEIFGGSPSVSHLVASSIADDSVDWDFGFTGKVQFVVVVQDPAFGDAGFETDNNKNLRDAEPRSNPTVYNATLVGGSTTPESQTGWVARLGTWGTIGNTIFTNFTGPAIDVRDAESVAGTTGAKPSLVVTSSMFFENGAAGNVHFSAEAGAADNDVGFDEDAYFRGAAWKNQFDVDPELPSIDPAAPNLVPPKTSPATMGGTPPAGFDTKAKYIGAFEPGGKDWMAGWTDFSAN